jgi:chaperonin cofactor prefoldin
MSDFYGLATLSIAILSGIGVLFVNSRTASREEMIRLQNRIIALESERERLEGKYEVLYEHHLRLEEEVSALKSELAARNQ